MRNLFSIVHIYKTIVLCCIVLVVFNTTSYCQNKSTSIIKYTVINVKKYGAKGDGKTNDFLAFKKIEEKINGLKKNVKLFIPKGTYLINSQNKNSIANVNINKKLAALFLSNVSNLIIEGANDSKIIYEGGQKFGSFDPKLGTVFKTNGTFTDNNYRQDIGSFIHLEKCDNVTISNLDLNGNINKMLIGGNWGDNGIQLVHDGLIIFNSNNISVNKVKSHHFGRDGIMIGNVIKSIDAESNNIKIINCDFSYNGRQGLSWIGGKGLFVEKSKFNYSGKNGTVSSFPGAGIDIEAEWGKILNGVFNNCEIKHNMGAGFIADSGESSDIELKNSTIVGSTSWSIWTVKPRFNITNCDIYGAVVHAYNSPNSQDATKFVKCKFSDYYNDALCFGNFLIEINGRKRVEFLDCDFTSVKQKLAWLDGEASWVKDDDAMPIVKNCNFYQKTINHINNGDYLFVMRVSKVSNCKFFINARKNEMRGLFIQNDGCIWKNNEIKYTLDEVR